MSLTGSENFEKFRQLVLSRVDMQVGLRDLADRDTFLPAVVELGAANGFAFTEQDVDDAMMQNRREWLERWI